VDCREARHSPRALVSRGGRCAGDLFAAKAMTCIWPFAAKTCLKVFSMN
jgi:hypothetical protein